jgi:hypothetical protein
MTPHEVNRAALLREREGRAAAYASAAAERDAMAAFAAAPDALEYDRRAFARAEARVGLALKAMEDWRDPLPTATHTDSAAPDRAPAPLGRSTVGAADTIEAVVARIMNA